MNRFVGGASGSITGTPVSCPKDQAQARRTAMGAAVILIDLAQRRRQILGLHPADADRGHDLHWLNIVRQAFAKGSRQIGLRVCGVDLAQRPERGRP